MADFALPEHMIAWIEGQVALGRFASVGSYLAELVAKDRGAQHRLANLQTAIAQAKASGISMQPSDSFLAQWLPQAENSATGGLKMAIRDGRESGCSTASLAGILARALPVQVAQAA